MLEVTVKVKVIVTVKKNNIDNIERDQKAFAVKVIVMEPKLTGKSLDIKQLKLKLLRTGIQRKIDQSR